MTEETIFLTALEQANPADRAAYLDAACGGDPALRDRVEALLRSHADPDSFLDTPALLRQAERGADPNRTSDLPPGAVGSAAEDPPPSERRPRVEESSANDGLIAFLAPGVEPGSLGRLDHYELIEMVGHGAMGLVFKARDTKLQRIVAIKVLAPQVAAYADARKRFVREAQMAAAVRDDHVVSIYAVGDEGPVAFLAMEFIGGVTLEKLVKQSGPMKVKEILRIGIQVAAGLAAAHRQGLIHRDVKPANILLENGVQRVKIADFGLARAADDASLTRIGFIAGTPLFMSPEQARGEELDPRSDLFSLGSVLYMLCTVRPAFAAENTMAVLKRVCEDLPRPIREVNPDIPEWLAGVVDRLLAKEPGERFQTATELVDVLEHYLAPLQQSRLTPSAPPERPRIGPPLPSPATDASPAPRTRKRLAAAALLLMVGFAASLAIVAVLLRKPPSTSSAHSPEVDPSVLTVSKKPEDGGRFRTIQEALDNVDPGMTIRVLDDATYDEYLVISQPLQHERVTLETAGNATIRRQPRTQASVWIRGVPHFTLRGFRFDGTPNQYDYREVYVTGRCPGVVLDQLNITKGRSDAVVLYDVPLAGNDAPIVIQNCTIRVGDCAVVIKGRVHGDAGQPVRPLPCRRVVIRNNTLDRCNMGVVLNGVVYKVHIVGNRFRDSRRRAIELEDLREGTADVLIANNTLFRCESAVGIWDDHNRGEEFLECKSIRVQNNLVFETVSDTDMLLSNRLRGDHNAHDGDGDLNGLRNSPEWRFSHNWRDVDEQRGSQVPGRWIPYSLTDHRLKQDLVMLLKHDDRNFLRPAKDSPLAWSGAGGHTVPSAQIGSAVGQASSLTNPWMAGWLVAQPMSRPDPSLPAYVGAVPPEGVDPWDWEKTWTALTR